jgi:hypothetical protein
LFANVAGVGVDAYRRSVYIQSKRALPLAMLETFDLPAMSPNCDLRRSTTGPAQALVFLNDEFVLKNAGELAERLWREAHDDEARIVRAYRLLFAVDPTETQRRQSLSFLVEANKRFAADPDKNWQAQIKKRPHAPALRSLESLCQILLASNRFLYVD